MNIYVATTFQRVDNVLDHQQNHLETLLVLLEGGWR